MPIRTSKPLSIAFGWFVLLFPLCGSTAATPYPVSDHYDGRHFHNLDAHAQVDKSLWDILKWKFTSKSAPWPVSVPNTQVPALPAAVGANELYATFVNHATELVQFQSLNVLTDPVFSERVSPFTWIGPKRVRAPGIALDQLPRIDVVLISHNHYDHLDLASLKKLEAMFHPKFIVPLGNARLLRRKHIADVVELDWWQTLSYKGADITLVPAQHWSTRGPFTAFRSLWGGYVIQAGDLRVFFAGDTGYAPHFKTIESRFGPMDVSFLPIGAYKPRWFMKNQHMDPAEAVQAHLDLKSTLSIAMHFGTFKLSDEGMDEPVKDLGAALRERHLPDSVFIAPENGQTSHYTRSR